MRQKTVKVKTAKSRSISSSNWLNRHLNDTYVVKSKIDGYRSRAAYKLIELNEKYNLIKPNFKIIDLGAAPGGWSQVLSEIINKNGKIIASDLLDIQAIEKVVFFQGDFTEENIQNQILNEIVSKADLILSDMAPNTTGHQTTDQLRIADLCEKVFEFSVNCLTQGGSLVFKIFQGGTEAELLAKIKKVFSSVKHFKPPASRKESSEIYLVAQGYKGE